MVIFLSLFCGSALIIGILFVVFGSLEDDYYGGRDEGMIALGIVFIVGLAILPAVLVPISQYSSNICLEERILALYDTVKEQSALIAENATIGSGLEGLEIKREIQATIRELNYQIANGKIRIRSPWWLFRPIPVWEGLK